MNLLKGIKPPTNRSYSYISCQPITANLTYMGIILEAFKRFN